MERRRQLRRKELEAQKRFHGSLYVSVLSVRSGPAPHTIPGFAPVSRSTNPSRERAQGQGQGGSGANVFLLPVGRGAGNCAPEHDRLTRVSGPPASPRLAPPRASGPPHVCASDHGHRRSMEWEQDFSLQVVASQPRLGLLRPPHNRAVLIFDLLDWRTRNARQPRPPLPPSCPCFSSLVQCAPPPTPRSRRQRRVQVAPSRSLRVALVQVVEAAGHSPAAEGLPAAGRGAAPTPRRGQVGSGAPPGTGAEADRAERARVRRQSTWRQLGGREQVVGELFLPLRALESGAPRKRSARARPSVPPPETAPSRGATWPLG